MYWKCYGVVVLCVGRCECVVCTKKLSDNKIVWQKIMRDKCRNDKPVGYPY